MKYKTFINFDGFPSYSKLELWLLFGDRNNVREYNGMFVSKLI